MKDATEHNADVTEAKSEILQAIDRRDLAFLKHKEAEDYLDSATRELLDLVTKISLLAYRLKVETTETDGG